MAKFIVTLVVETEKDKPAPTKKMLKQAIQNEILGGWVDITDSTRSDGSTTEMVSVRVRSVALD